MNEPRTVFTFGAFHYDVAYRDTYEGYRGKSFDAIQAGLRLLAAYPDYCFAIEQVILVREFLNRYPEAKATMQRFVREGRLCFAPGMFTMPDVNLANGESFIRNAVTGREWLWATLGAAPTICWMADIFGHHAQLPQMATHCGFSGYMFERGKTGGDDVTFWWEGIDGSRILTHWEIDTYYGIAIPLAPYLAVRGPAWMARYAEAMLLNPLDANSRVRRGLLTAMGGDFRKPDDKDIAFVRAYNDMHRAYRIAFGSPETYFAQTAETEADALPIVRSDFNPLMQGVYSSRIRIKQANRRLENLAAALELLEAGLVLQGRPVREASAALWETQMWNAFHDILAGTLEEHALREALRDYAGAERRGVRALVAAVNRCATNMPAADNGGGAVFYNSLPYARDELVTIPLDDAWRRLDTATPVDASGAPLETQQLMTVEKDDGPVLDLEGKEQPAGAADTAARKAARATALLVRVTVPPCSVRAHAIVARPAEPGAAANLSVRDDLLENRFLHAVIARNGTVVSLIDKRTGREFADPGRSPIAACGMNNIALQPDRGDLWSLYQGPVNGSLLYTAPWYEEDIEQVFEYALRPFHSQEPDYNPARLGARFNRPIHVSRVDAGAPLPALDPIVTLDGAHAELMCFRDLGGECEARVYESRGRGGPVGLTFAAELAACRRTDGAGRPRPDPALRVGGNGFGTDLKPFEIATFRLAFAARTTAVRPIRTSTCGPTDRLSRSETP